MLLAKKCEQIEIQSEYPKGEEAQILAEEVFRVFRSTELCLKSELGRQ